MITRFGHDLDLTENMIEKDNLIWWFVILLGDVGALLFFGSEKDIDEAKWIYRGGMEILLP